MGENVFDFHGPGVKKPVFFTCMHTNVRYYSRIRCKRHRRQLLKLEGADPTLMGSNVQMTAAVQHLIGAASVMPGVEAAAKRVSELARYAPP